MTWDASIEPAFSSSHAQLDLMLCRGSERCRACLQCHTEVRRFRGGRQTLIGYWNLLFRSRRSLWSFDSKQCPVNTCLHHSQMEHLQFLNLNTQMGSTIESADFTPANSQLSTSTPTSRMHDADISSTSQNNEGRQLALRSQGVKKERICQFCGKQFDRPSLLQRHARTHTKEKPFSCQQCGKAFATKTSCKIHERIHSGEQPFVCETCGCKFNASSNLINHRKWKHDLEQREHKCSECGKLFVKPSDLRRHKCTHEGAFKCSQCDKAFRREGAYLRHKKSHNTAEQFRCIICNKCFSHEDHLNTHKQTHALAYQEVNTTLNNQLACMRLPNLEARINFHSIQCRADDELQSAQPNNLVTLFNAQTKSTAYQDAKNVPQAFVSSTTINSIQENQPSVYCQSFTSCLSEYPPSISAGHTVDLEQDENLINQHYASERTSSDKSLITSPINTEEFSNNRPQMLHPLSQAYHHFEPGFPMPVSSHSSNNAYRSGAQLMEEGSALASKPPNNLSHVALPSHNPNINSLMVQKEQSAAYSQPPHDYAYEIGTSNCENPASQYYQIPPVNYNNEIPNWSSNYYEPTPQTTNQFERSINSNRLLDAPRIQQIQDVENRRQISIGNCGEYENSTQLHYILPNSSSPTQIMTNFPSTHGSHDIQCLGRFENCEYTGQYNSENYGEYDISPWQHHSRSTVQNASPSQATTNWPTITSRWADQFQVAGNQEPSYLEDFSQSTKPLHLQYVTQPPSSSTFEGTHERDLW